MVVMPAKSKYLREIKERAARLIVETRKVVPDLSVTAAAKRIGTRTRVNADALCGWFKRAEIDTGQRPGTTTADAARIKQLGAEVGELNRTNEILMAAPGFLHATDRPAFALAAEFDDVHRIRFGVEPICRVLT